MQELPSDLTHLLFKLFGDMFCQDRLLFGDIFWRDGPDLEQLFNFDKNLSGGQHELLTFDGTYEAT